MGVLLIQRIDAGCCTNKEKSMGKIVAYMKRTKLDNKVFRERERAMKIRNKRNIVIDRHIKNYDYQERIKFILPPKAIKKINKHIWLLLLQQLPFMKKF